MILLYIREAVNRFMIGIFGSAFFEMPLIRRIRECVYCWLFRIKWPVTFISKHVVFYRSHLQVVCVNSGNSSVGKIVAGHHIALSSGVKVDYTGGITIGDFVDISEDVRIYTHRHRICKERMSFTPDTIEPSSLTVGDFVWIGAGSIILPGVHRIGNNAIIGAGSVVTKDVPDDVIIAGNPAVLVRKLNDYEIKKR